MWELHIGGQGDPKDSSALVAVVSAVWAPTTRTKYDTRVHSTAGRVYTITSLQTSSLPEDVTICAVHCGQG